jgi:hypothetical protein
LIGNTLLNRGAIANTMHITKRVVASIAGAYAQAGTLVVPNVVLVVANRSSELPKSNAATMATRLLQRSNGNPQAPGDLFFS